MLYSIDQELINALVLIINKGIFPFSFAELKQIEDKLMHLPVNDAKAEKVVEVVDG